MKTRILRIHSFILPALLAAFGLIPAGWVTAQTFTNLHSFTGTASDGSTPQGLILSGSTLYGTGEGIVSGGYGTVFTINTDGTGFNTLYAFTSLVYPGVNGDGQFPLAGLILSNNTLYGTAWQGGSANKGTVFRVDTNGGSFTNLHNFVGYPSDGSFPKAGLIFSANSNILYGTSYKGGSAAGGTVFAINTDGTGFTILHSFLGDATDPAWPLGGLILSGNTLYGTASVNGPGNNGTVFAVNTAGTVYTNLHSFTGSDGASPQAGLILSGNILYGTAYQGGASSNGTVFAVNTDGTGFTNLHSFTAASTNSSGVYTNSDGANPWAGLILSGNILYGTASKGGASGNGTVFAVNTDGTGFTNLHSFTALSNSTNSDGANPQAGLILSDNTLYGAAVNGGGSGRGTVFSLSLAVVVAPPGLTIIHSGTNVILMWPTNAAGFTLESTTNLVSPVWTTNSPGPVVVNGQNSVTNSASGTRQFYRLIQ